MIKKITFRRARAEIDQRALLGLLLGKEKEEKPSEAEAEPKVETEKVEENQGD